MRAFSVVRELVEFFLCRCPAIVNPLRQIDYKWMPLVAFWLVSIQTTGKSILPSVAFRANCTGVKCEK